MNQLKRKPRLAGVQPGRSLDLGVDPLRSEQLNYA
jgi:hypothetical protein